MRCPMRVLSDGTTYGGEELESESGANPPGMHLCLSPRIGKNSDLDPLFSIPARSCFFSPRDAGYLG